MVLNAQFNRSHFYSVFFTICMITLSHHVSDGTVLNIIFEQDHANNKKKPIFFPLLLPYMVDTYAVRRMDM